MAKKTKTPAPKTDAPRVPRRPIKPAKKADDETPAPTAKRNREAGKRLGAIIEKATGPIPPLKKETRAKPAPAPAPEPAAETVTLNPAQKAWATRKANGWKHPGSSAPKPAPEPIRRANLAEIAAQGG